MSFALAECKRFLWFCAVVAGGGALLAIAISLWLMSGKPPSPRIVLATMTLFFLTFLAWLVAMLLLSEFTRATRGPPSFSRDPALSGSEVASLTSNCPPRVWYAVVAAIAVAVLQWIKVGDADVALGGDISPRQLRALLSGAIVFLSMSVPVLVSAARMGGGFEDQSDST
jgi:hypothetical protein